MLVPAIESTGFFEAGFIIGAFSVENFSFADRLGLSPYVAALRPGLSLSLYGPAFGPPVGRPFMVQPGFRVDFQGPKHWPRAHLTGRRKPLRRPFSLPCAVKYL